MEVRSSRRVRTLVTQMARSGLSANEIAPALISMMARSNTRSNQRPDTLMQDRSPPARRNLLRRTAGPYIGSQADIWQSCIWFGCHRFCHCANMLDEDADQRTQHPVLQRQDCDRVSADF